MTDEQDDDTVARACDMQCWIGKVTYVRADVTQAMQAARIAALEAEVSEWRRAFTEDGRDTRYFSKAMSAQAKVAALEADLARARERVEALERDALKPAP